ncbi:MAG: cation transporter, partial [Gemmatimonadetes bacterium]|nr:cation transporter [Gemmatimonadota bacterium]
VIIFVVSCIAIIPMAGIMGRATEHLAERVGPGLGGLLNASFGNAAELIIAILALRKGLYGVVKASLTGSIIGNGLLVFGLASLLGGLKFPRQAFNRTAANLGATMLLLSAVGLVVPSVFHLIQGADAVGERSLSLEISIVLMFCYALSLVFALRTHGHLYAGAGHASASGGGHGRLDEHAAQGSRGPQAADVVAAEGAATDGPAAGGAAAPEEHHVAWSRGRSFLVLLGAAALVGWMSEILVGGAEEAAHTLGMNEVFVGVIVVALIGNAAEHSTAVLVALKNKMDLSLQIAVGSSVQIALFIAPLLVFLSFVIGPRPMDLVFSPLEVVAVAISVLVVGQISDDGESHWMEGALLLGVYVVLGLAFFNLAI